MAYNICSAQFYFVPHSDEKGLSTRIGEHFSANFYKDRYKTTRTEFLLSAANAAALRPSKVYFNSYGRATINYANYRNLCGSYLNPFKKTTCTNKFNYIKSAHDQILRLVSVSLRNQVNKGVREQIMIKYTHIINTLTKELEALKLKEEKDNYYTRLFIPQG